ncbi:acyltransferase family protein [Paraburkholderia phosphatilytica]|uniref:acyltransferase family protein n=1 Tax=Paraburkholderia phosphatilytica TaxID=2282883 RepID=UPI000E480370|nr:acyltransferase [Paraburkholderia phosphatilytica]
MASEPEHKLANLEILRFLCSFSVLIFHYPVLTYVGNHYGNPPHSELPFECILSPFFDRGFLAVQYFWCISGFIFFWKYQNTLRSQLTGREFFALRLSRLYPLHIATLLYIALMQLSYRSMIGSDFVYVNNTPFTFFLHLLMLGNLQHPFNDSFNGVTWSVSVEVFAYISFFVVCRYFRQSGAMALLIAFVCSIAFVRFRPDNNFLQCFALFYLGGCACIVHRWIVRYRLALFAAIALFAYYGVLTWCRSFWPDNGYFRMVICIPPVVLAFACVPIPRLPLIKWVQRAGELTYSVYMLHFPIILTAVTVAAAFGMRLDYRSKWLFIAFVLTVFGTATLCYRYFEKPAQRALRRLMLKAPAVSPKTAATTE